MLNLSKERQEYEGKAHPYQDLLPWMELIREDMVLDKDGGLLVCYEMPGIDVENLQESDKDRYASLIEHAMRVFNERVTVWWTVDRRRTDKYTEGVMPDEISQLIDDTWRNEFIKGNQYENKHYLSILFSPETGASGFMERIGYFSTRKNYSLLKSAYMASLAAISRKRSFAFDAEKIAVDMERFDDLMAAFDETIRDAGLKRIEGEALLAFLHKRTNPANNQPKVRKQRIAGYLDSYLPDNTLYVGHDTLLFESDEVRYASAVSVKDWPEVSAPGMLDSMLGVAGEITISQAFMYVDQDEAKKYIDGIRKHNLNTSKSIMTYLKETFTNTESDKVDESKLHKAQDAIDAMNNMTINNRQFGYYNLSIIAYGSTKKECEETMKAVTSNLRQKGFLVVKETLHLLSAWAATLPGQWSQLVRTFFVHTGNMADLSPIWSRQTGPLDNPYLTEQTGKYCSALTTLSTEFATPFYFNFHNGDLAHTMVIGPSRTGKSVFLNFLVSQFGKYAPCKRVVFDKDYSCKIPTLLQGGAHIDMSGESPVRLNPLSLLGDKEHWSFLVQWIENLLTSRGYDFKSEDEQLVWKAFEKMSVLPKDKWMLRSLYGLMGSNRLNEELMPWIGDGANAKYFDNEADDFALGDFTCIEVGTLFMNSRLASLFLEYAFYRIKIDLDGKPTLIELEEAWLMLSDDRFTRRINDWLKTLAKKNAFLVMATQSLDELATSDIFASIIDNIPNRIFLPNPNANAHREMYTKKFSLNDEQVDRIRNAVPKLNYYINTPVMSRMARFRCPPEILACLRSDSRAQKTFTKHYENKGSDIDWKYSYIKEMVND
jgi:type IV secretion system protein VirB4